MKLLSKEGHNVPAVSFKTRSQDDWATVTSDQIFKDQTVVVFALPGAYTPTCSASHVPGYNELAPHFKEAGVDRIVCLSVNDPFVMQSWANDQAADNLEFLPDGNGEFSRAMGMLVDKSDLNFGPRSWRYSMLVRDGVIEKMFIENDQPGDPFEVSDAETMLHHLNPDFKRAPTAVIMTKDGCPHCVRAKRLLKSRGYVYEEVLVGTEGLSFEAVTAMTGQRTVPQVYIGGQRIGGADDLENWLTEHSG